MPIYRVKLEDSDSGEFRLVAVNADSKEEARAVCERQEARHVGFWLGEADLDEVEEKESTGTLSGREKARLYSHRQQKPYEIVSVKAEKEDES